MDAPPTEPLPQRSLTRQVLGRVALWSGLAVLAITGAAYLLAYNQARDAALAKLQSHVGHRALSAVRPFREAEAHLQVFRKAFLERYRADVPIDYSARFDAMFKADAEGALRLDRRYYDGFRLENGEYVSGITAFIGRKRGTIDDDFKKRMVVAIYLLARLGPAWGSPFANLHASFPENGMAIYWPDEPWGLEARADLDMVAGAVIAGTVPENNPGRLPVWSGLYYDRSAEQWTVTYQLPVDDAGRHLLNPSHDILLAEIIERLTESSLPDSRTLLVSRKGEVVAWDSADDVRYHESGVMHVEKLTDPVPARIYAEASRALADAPSHFLPRLLRDPATGDFLAVVPIDGPDWWLITIYPRTLVAAEAHAAARAMLLLGLALQAALMAVLWLILRQRVELPVAQLKHAADRIAENDHAAVGGGDVPLPTGDRNEIGALARALRDMAAQIHARRQRLEDTVNERTRDLAEANQRLETLSRTDPLTRLPNRRAFDADLEQALVSARLRGEPVSLCMLDVDFFKAYNDALGHEAGDQALQLVADALLATCRRQVRCFRYGGEEFAMLLTGPATRHAERIVNQLLESLRSQHVPHPSSPFNRLTLSAGLATLEGTALDAGRLLRAADQALYAAKASGRDRLLIGA